MSKMSKLRLSGLFILALLVMPLGTVFATDYNYAAISVSTLRYEPFPAQPGSYLKVWFNVENIGTEAAEDLQVVIEPKYPFELDPSDTAVRDIRTLEGKESTYIDYKLRVAADAVEGENTLTLRYSTGDRQVWVEKKVKIEVQTLDVNLDILSAKSEPVPPGGVTPLEIIIKNDGDSTLRDISVQLDISTLPFYPINSTAKKKIYLMGGGETQTLKFNLMAAPSADCQPYKIPITLTYQTLDGTQYTKSDYITLIVCAEPEVEISLEASDILVPGTKGTVNVNIINKGLSDVKFLTIELKEDSYEIISAPQIYIGNLDSDDFDSAEFDIFVGNTAVAGSELPMVFSITYRDGNNNLHSGEVTVPLRIYTQDELSRYGLVPPQSNTGLVILLLIIVVVGYWLLKRRKRKK